VGIGTQEALKGADIHFNALGETTPEKLVARFNV